jgi:hypothetical protein
MKTIVYTVSIDLEKPTNEVFSKLINLSAWWPEDYEGDSLKLNDEFVLKTEDSHFSRNRVIDFVPEKKFGWITLESFRKSDNYDWSGTKMIFELKPKNEGTILIFTYDGVVLENEQARLVQICNLTMKDMFFNFVMKGKEK